MITGSVFFAPHIFYVLIISFCFFLTTAKASNQFPSYSPLNQLINKIDSSTFEELYANNILLIDSIYLIDEHSADPLPHLSSLSQLAQYYFEKSRFNDARLVVEQILLQGEEEKDWKAMASAHNFGSLVAELEEQYMDVYFHNKKLLEFGEKYDPVYSTMAYLNQGNFLYEQNFHEEAIKKYQAGLATCDKQSYDQEYGWLLHRLGECYRGAGRYEIAKSHLQDALKFWQKIDNNRAYSFTLIQLGMIEQALNNTEAARQIFLQTLDLTEQNNLWLSQVNTLITIGKFELELGLYDKAIDYLEQATKISMEQDIPFYFERSHAALAKAYQATGQIYKANNSYQEYLNEINKNLKNKEEATTAWANNMDMLYEKEVAYNSLMQLEQEQTEKLRIHRLLLWLSIALLTLVGWTAFNFFRAYKRNKKQKEILSHKNLKISQQADALAIANENILSQKKELEVKVLKNLLQLSKSIESQKELSDYLDNCSETKDTFALKKILRNSKDESMWEELDLQISQVNSDFFERLSKRFDNLTKGDLRLCALLKMNLRTKEIANLTFRNPESIKVARSRLRKKLGLTHSNTDISSFLNQI